MAISLASGSSRRARVDMNVTPLIDVLLVLIIIFLVIQPNKSEGLPALVPAEPDPATAAAPPEPDPTTVVLEVRGDQSLAINTQPVAREQLGNRLREIFAQRAAKILFVKGDPRLEFAQVAGPIDTARGAGITQIALLR